MEEKQGFAIAVAAHAAAAGEQQTLAVLRRVGERAAEEARVAFHLSVAPSFAAYVSNMLRLERGLVLAGRFEEDELARLAARVLAGREPWRASALDVWRLQWVFESQYVSLQAEQAEARAKRDAANAAQMDRICAAAATLHTPEHVTALYRATYKLLMANRCDESVLGQQQQQQQQGGGRLVEREVAAALESVLPQSSLAAFSLLSEADKRQQLEQLVQIVLGIRLFNREIGKGGAGMPDVLGEASLLLDKALREVQSAAEEVAEAARGLSMAIRAELQFPGSIASPVQALRAQLALRRQALLMLHQVAHESTVAQSQLRALQTQWAAEVSALKAAVSDRVSVPKELVYPGFMRLAEAWRAAAQLARESSGRVRLVEEVSAQVAASGSSLDAGDVALARARGISASESADETAPAAVDDERFGFVRGVQFGESKDASEVVRVAASNSPGFLSLALELQGFCPVAMARHAGLLLPGNPLLGVVRLGDKHYAFSSVEAMRAFCDEPQQLLSDLVAAVRAHPELLHLLALDDANGEDAATPASLPALLAAFAPAESERVAQLQRGAAADADTQTPTHVEEEKLVAGYEWNEWNLRRRAIQLADLTRKATRSTQTHLSHFRRENETQTTLKPLEPDGTAPGTGTQTGIAKGTNVVRTHRFVTGLRGEPEARVRVVTLTLPPVVHDGSNAPLAKS
jgi:hypothetical protein